MRVRVKICGLTELHAVRAAVDAGVDAVGLVFAESLRLIDPVRARELFGLVPPSVARVAVFRHPSLALVRAVRQAIDPDWYQSDAADEPVFGEIGRRFLPVFREGLDEPRLRVHLAAGRGPFLYEGRVSGSGTRVNWDRAAEYSRRGLLVLAGGLDAGNVAEAIARVRPYAVDVSSGVESRPGIKDAGRIREFVAAVRAEGA